MKRYLTALLCIIMLVIGSIGLVGAADEEDKKEILYPIVDDGRYYVQDGVGYFHLIGSVSYCVDPFIRACKVFDRVGVDKIVVILISGGGSIFEGMAVAQLMEEQIKAGKIVEVRSYGVVASAAVVIMVSGSKGHRYIAPSALVMIHELTTYKVFSAETVSDQEKNAKISRMIQDMMIGYMAAKTKLNSKEFHEKCKEESWANAVTAIEWGFADKLI